ncbi:MAG: site-2 protease family protein [Nitrososphaerota archaeon]|nr:site-2 protease family protein [Nitrososphaerota archaeon]
MRIKLPSMIEIQFPFILIRTKIGLSLIEKLGKTRPFRKIGFASTIVMPFLGAIMIYFLISSIINILDNPQLSKVLRELGPAANILLPGLNPYLPIFYGWIALLIAMIIHEFSHGVQARANEMNVKSTGIVLFLVIPIGAFVEVDEKQLEEAGLGKASRALSAGPVSNIITAFIALAIFIILILSLKPIVNGILVSGLVVEGSAHQAGMRLGDIIVGVNDDQTPDLNSFRKAVLKAYEQNKNITFHVLRNRTKNHTFTLGRNLSNSGIVSLIPLKDVLEEYSLALMRSPIEGIMIYLMIPTVPFPWVYERIPFSDQLQKYYVSTILGKDYYYFVNFFFWIWFVNFNLGVFNALPLYPLDGGIMFKLLCKRKLSKKMSIKTIDRMVYVISLILFSLIISTIIIPYFMG